MEESGGLSAKSPARLHPAPSDPVPVCRERAPDQDMQKSAIQGAIEAAEELGKIKFRMLWWDSQKGGNGVRRDRDPAQEPRGRSRSGHAHHPVPCDASNDGRHCETIVLLELSSRAHALHKALLALCGHPMWSLVSASLK